MVSDKFAFAVVDLVADLEHVAVGLGKDLDHLGQVFEFNFWASGLRRAEIAAGVVGRFLELLANVPDVNQPKTPEPKLELHAAIVGVPNQLVDVVVREFGARKVARLSRNV